MNKNILLIGIVNVYFINICFDMNVYTFKDELQWLEQLWDFKNMFETGVVRANEC